MAIDRQLPFLVVYRQPVRVADEGTAKFATSEASYLVAPGQKKHQAGVTRLVRAIAEVMVEEFGSFLVLEIWSGPPVATELRAQHRRSQTTVPLRLPARGLQVFGGRGV